MNYPKTYEECCEALHVTSENIEKKVKYESEALKSYQRVIAVEMLIAVHTTLRNMVSLKSDTSSML